MIDDKKIVHAEAQRRGFVFFSQSRQVAMVFVCALFLFGSFAEETFGQMAKKMGKGKAPFMTIKEFNEVRGGIVILDTRELKEWNVSHIKNSVSVGYDKFSVGSMAKYPKSVMIICYCSVGYRSQKIAEKLLKNGYTKVYNLYGGIFNWVNQGNAVVDGNNIETKKIHGYSKDWAKWLTKGEKVFN